jgi:hypothetical protein
MGMVDDCVRDRSVITTTRDFEAGAKVKERKDKFLITILLRH